MPHSPCFPTLFFFIFFLFHFPTESKPSVGFSVDIIHSQSHISPTYNPSTTHFDFFRNSAANTVTRSNHFGLFSYEKTVQSSVYPNGGDYIMRFSIGTPPFETYATMDTGSDVVWIQCLPCNKCINRKAQSFDSSKSSTYKELACGSRTCVLGRRFTRCTSNNVCGYYLKYQDGTYSNGTMGKETLTFSSTTGAQVSVRNFAFGCGRNNSGIFKRRETGVAGLGNGKFSVVSQLGRQTDGKFSYCLILYSYPSTSKLRFGSDAVLSGLNAVSTPLVLIPGLPYYFITLLGINVGRKPAVAVNSGAKNSGNMIIDSGTTFIALETTVYDSLESNIRSLISATPATDPDSNFRLCYPSQSNITYPKMTFRFDGANIRLKPYNTFGQVSPTLICLLIVPTTGIPIFGNFAQVNFDVGYDLRAKRLYFSPKDCRNR